MHQCKLVVSDAGHLRQPESSLFLVAIPRPGDLVMTGGGCFLVEAVQEARKGRPKTLELRTEEPGVVLHVRREAAGAPAGLGARSNI